MTDSNKIAYPRIATKLIKKYLVQYPAVALIGPRQSGKTTLAETISDHYFDLEKPGDRIALDLDWDHVINSEGLVVFDEAQTWPELFSRLRGDIDKDSKRNGRFLLLSSISPSLMTQVSQSLAGRMTIVELSTLLKSELEMENQHNQLWLYGGYPDVSALNDSEFPTWQMNYLQLLAKRDLPEWGMPSSAGTTLDLLSMLATCQGQFWNASHLGKSLGLSYHTINRYLEFLEGSFLVLRLPAFQTTTRKRLVKSKKFYFRDTGLLHALLDIKNQDELLRHPSVTASWKGFVINQILATMRATGGHFNAYHFRTSDQYELDLVIKSNFGLWAIEVKLTSRPGHSDLARLNSVADLIDADRRILICNSTKPAGNDSQMVCNLDHLLKELIH